MGADAPGQRLTWRSTSKVVVSRKLPRSAVGQWRVGVLLDRRGQRCALAFIVRIGEDGVGLVGALGQQRQHLGMGAQRGAVLAAGPYARGPDRSAVGRGDELHVAAMGGV